MSPIVESRFGKFEIQVSFATLPQNDLRHPNVLAIVSPVSQTLLTSLGLKPGLQQFALKCNPYLNIRLCYCLRVAVPTRSAPGSGSMFVFWDPKDNVCSLAQPRIITLVSGDSWLFLEHRPRCAFPIHQGSCLAIKLARLSIFHHISTPGKCLKMWRFS